MPIQTLLSELDRKVILFSFEKQQKTKIEMPFSFLNEDYRSYVLTQGEYILWELEKRKLQEVEVISHSWMLTSKNNTSIIFEFKAENVLCLQSLFSEQTQFGMWSIVNGILKINYSNEGHDYDISIIANNNRLIHSALQITDEHNVDLLKVVPISSAKCGKSLIE